ncbi:cysteine--tRNA ligase [Marivita lacus]|uniref:Cysteine--tRNA ligase n=1 Tax=Marivita lacus TaxID=1323742 RepID=A0ABQ1KK56_9RHOB|nr:cysteine--tRNA ligase [Marivita lacus]GGB97075.1 cysteine--tRNA ligase [Marivita lacus]
MTIHLTNTATRQKEPFVPLDPDNVRMYVCGPTVYDRAHLGNARPVIVFDVLYRLLRHVYGVDHVTYVRNFTDVDDKINARAAESGRSIGDITDETTQWYLEDMAAVGALEPSIRGANHDKAMPRATAYIAEMIAMIEDLIAKGFAYTAPISFGHNSKAVYFNAEKAPEHAFFEVEKYSRYGVLSGRTVDEMISGARSERGEGKRSPMDFVLWKPSTIDQPDWESPWGRGRPGWHIECSAMAKSLLGSTFDIHGGGNDLMFPHHENEIAQSCCANGTEKMANFWLHNEMLQVEGKKMSKSLGNFFTVRDLLDQGVPGEVIRFVFLSTHYRKPMDWTAEKAREAKDTLQSWYNLTDGVQSSGKASFQLIDALSDDLNTPLALSILHEIARSGSAKELKLGMQLLGFTNPEQLDWWRTETVFLPGTFSSGSTPLYLNEIVPFLRKWQDLRLAKDYVAADALKVKLEKTGLRISNSTSGPTAVVPYGFDPSKLEDI